MDFLRRRSALALLASLLLTIAAAGCIDDGAGLDEPTGGEPSVEEYEYVSVGIDSGPAMDNVWSGPDTTACDCGDDWSCLHDWAEENFNCGVCVSVACGDRNAYACTDLCGMEQFEIRDDSTGLSEQ